MNRVSRKIALAIFCTIIMGGCVFDHDITPASPHAASAISGAAVQKDQASGLSRSSGAATQIRLALLFPNAPQSGSFDPSLFSFLNSSGIFSTLGSDQKPTTALAQIALREEATALCNSEFSSSDASSIFSTTDILLTGENVPSDPVQRLAFAAARNVWLDAYTVDMPEVQALITLYHQSLTAITGATGDLGARRAVCEAAILAPQFWIGSPLSTDVIRKMALEIGRRRPTFAEISAYKNGSLTTKSFVEKLQKESGYLKAINDWHQDWLGLRNFLPTGDPRGDSIPSGVGGYYGGASWFSGDGYFIVNPPAGANFTEQVLTPSAYTNVGGQNIGPAQYCTNVAQNFDPRTTQIVWEQVDVNPGPPSGLGVDEGWNVLGGQIHVDGVTAFKARLKTLYFTTTTATDSYSTDRNTSRGLMASTYTDENGLFTKLCTLSSNPSWYNCNGVVLLPASLRTQLQNEYTAITAASSATWSNPTDANYQSYVEKTQLDTVLAWDSGHSNLIHMITPLNGIVQSSYGWIGGITIPGGNNQNGAAYGLFYGQTDGAHTPLGTVMNWPAVTGNIIHSPIAYRGTTRLRRYSPSGEQNGYSLVTGWYKGTQLRVCNNLDHFPVTCAYSMSPNFQTPIIDSWSWSAASNTMADFTGHGIYNDTIGNYQSLSKFNCGVPDAGTMASNSNYTWPLGFTTTTDGNGATHYGSITALNVQASQIGYYDTTGVNPEGLAANQATYDVQNEPYHLLDYLVANNMDYRQLLTANYTCGGTDMAKLYQTQGYFLPVPAAQVDPKIGQLGNTCSVTNGDQNLFRIEHQGIQIAMNFLQSGGNYQAPLNLGTWLPLNVANASESAGQYEYVPVMPSATGGGYNRTDIQPVVTQIPERTMSGILTMPAFITPVMPSDRTLSSRYFTRLMCGDPSMFKPNADQLAMQSQFVSGRAHLQPQCISCHINLDPLAEAISSSFKYYESDGILEMGGELSGAGGSGSYNYVMGIKAGGGNKGHGAFLGSEVTGIADLGNAVANSTQFASCVVQTTFTNVVGRAPAATDATFLQTETSRFQNELNYNYNALIEDIVVSPTFTEKE